MTLTLEEIPVFKKCKRQMPGSPPLGMLSSPLSDNSSLLPFKSLSMYVHVHMLFKNQPWEHTTSFSSAPILSIERLVLLCVLKHSVTSAYSRGYSHSLPVMAQSPDGSPGTPDLFSFWPVGTSIASRHLYKDTSQSLWENGIRE